MMKPLTSVLPAALGLLLFGGSLSQDIVGPPRIAPNREIVLTPEERAVVLKGKVVLRELAPLGPKGRTYEALGLIQGSLDEAASVLTDFDRYAEFMPSVSAAKVRERDGPGAVVEITLHLPLGLKKQYRLRFTATRYEAGFELSWEKLDWPELKPSQTIADTTGFWNVRPFEDGGLIVVYRVYTDPGHVPLGLSGVARGLAKHKIPDGIVELRDRVRSVFRSAVK
jgi:hypothetical protein